MKPRALIHRENINLIIHETKRHLVRRPLFIQRAYYPNSAKQNHSSSVIYVQYIQTLLKSSCLLNNVSGVSCQLQRLLVLQNTFKIEISGGQ